MTCDVSVTGLDFLFSIFSALSFTQRTYVISFEVLGDDTSVRTLSTKC